MVILLISIDYGTEFINESTKEHIQYSRNFRFPIKSYVCQYFKYAFSSMYLSISSWIPSISLGDSKISTKLVVGF